MSCFIKFECLSLLILLLNVCKFSLVQFFSFLIVFILAYLFPACVLLTCNNGIVITNFELHVMDSFPYISEMLKSLSYCTKKPKIIYWMVDIHVKYQIMKCWLVSKPVLNLVFLMPRSTLLNLSSIEKSTLYYLLENRIAGQTFIDFFLIMCGSPGGFQKLRGDKKAPLSIEF